MRNFRCSCGQTLFFENTLCLQCNKMVGFDPKTLTMGPIAHRQLCRNGTEFDVCNWLVTERKAEYCISCGLNHTIPNLLQPNRRKWWKSLEQAKRRLIYSLISLRLPLISKRESEDGLAFKFMEDKRTNPSVYEDHVSTGHDNGLITINIAEADRVSREITRQYTGELYRTLLGHFRHESGHYYYQWFIERQQRFDEFRKLFGDERVDYAAALEHYYANKDTLLKQPQLISHYAQAHPLEDWAEVWAHYLHMVDTLDTASHYHMQQGSAHWDDIDELLLKWSELSMMLNALNRSMGLEDAYPFTLSDATFNKLRFVHSLIYPS